MKKIALIMLVLFLIILDFAPKISLAQEDISKKPENSHSIKSYTAFVWVNPDGSMDIEEYVSYGLNKNFSGTLSRKIDTLEASGLENLQIYEVMDLDLDNIQNSKKELINEDSYGILYDSEYGTVEEIEVVLDNWEKEKTIAFKYTLFDLMGIYKDMALLNWTFINKEESLSLDDITININIPKISNVDDVHSILQGPLYSSSNVNESEIVYDAHSMDKEHGLKLLMLLPTSIIPQGRKKIENDITQDVLMAMEDYNQEIEAKRSEIEGKHMTISLLTYITLALIVAIFIYLYLRYDRDPKSSSRLKQTNKLPADYYTPAELGVFMNRGRIKFSYITATLIDLINKGNLHIKSSEDGVFIISKDPNLKPRRLKAHEEYLLKWIYDDFGQNSSEISTSQLRGLLEDEGNKKRYKFKYKTWSNLVKKQTLRWKFFEDVEKSKLYGMLFGLLTSIPGILLCTMGANIEGAIIIIMSLILMVYSRLTQKRTEFGAINNAQWLAFKNYISNISKSHLPSPEKGDWNKFLPYTITLGCAEILIDELRLVFHDEGIESEDFSFFSETNIDKTLEWIGSGRQGLKSKFRFMGHIKAKKSPKSSRISEILNSLKSGFKNFTTTNKR